MKVDGDDEAIELSVVLPTFNGAETIGAQLDALLTQDAPVSWELVIVDNGSTDGTRAVVEQVMGRQERVRVVDAPDAHNLSYVRNVGAERARGRGLAFVDDDDVVAPGWLAAIASALQSHALVASRLEYGLLNDAGSRVGRGRFQTDHVEELFSLPILVGAGHGCRRDLWERLGGNDERFAETGEDFDFAMRAYRSTGVRPVLVEDAVYHYRLRTGLRQEFRQARRYGSSHALLYRSHASGSMSARERLADAGREWWWLLTRLPLLVRPERRTRWVTVLGRRVGRLAGSVRYRVLLP